MGTLFSLAAFILSIMAISRSSDASLKIANLEKKLKMAETGTLGVAEVSPVVSSEERGMPSLQEKVATPQQVEEYKESGFIAWLKEDWLLKLGGVLVLMGVLFFLSLAFTAVGPQGKVSIGYIFGIALMVFGFRYAKKQLVGGSAIHLIGAIVVIITTYLARQPGYNLFDPYLATLLMFLTTVCVALTAFAYKRASLAHAGLFIAAFVPMLTNTESNSFAMLLLYLGVVTLGVLWLALVTKWRTLVLLALAIVCGYSVMKITGGLGSPTISLTESYMVIAFGVLFYLTSLLSIFRSQGTVQQADGVVALLNAGFALMWIIPKSPHEIAPMIIALVGFIYAVGFFLVYKVTNVYTSFLVYGGVALGLLTTSVMMQLSGRSLAVTLLLMGAGVTYLTQYLSREANITKTVAFFNILPMFYVFSSVIAINNAIYNVSLRGDVWKDFLIVGLAMALYFSLYFYFVKNVKELSYVSLTAGLVTLIITTWQVFHMAIIGGFATFMSILVYTIVGLSVLFQGTHERNDTKVRLAKLWLGLVAGRVIFWDAWQLDNIVLGVLICIVIGVLLLSSTFLIKKVVTE